MPPRMSRRNGRQASCEPCRKSKIRCDHEVPVCARCRRRGLQARCWYNPSPLTRRGSGVFRTDEAQSSTNSSNLPPELLPGEQGEQPERAHVIQPGVTDQTERSDSPTLPSNTLTFRGSSHDEKALSEQQAILREIVSELHHLPVIQELLHDYFPVSQVALIPKILISHIASSIRQDPAIWSLISQPAVENASKISQLAERILKSTATQVLLTPDMDFKDFCSLYCGENLRVETLGLIYTTAARSVFFKKNHDAHNPDRFLQMLFRCSNLSLRLAHDVVPQTNDILTWLAYENMLLATLVEGDASLGIWQRLGDVSTDVYALGLHREASLSPKVIPFFLSELRRKVYVSAYQADKTFAQLFDRPPRIARRYSDCKMPLDLGDEEIFAENLQVLEQARKDLSLDGWNTKGKHRSTTWARLRYIVGEFREETTEYTLFSLASDDYPKLRNLSDRCHDKWDSLPPHLHYDKSCWTSDTPSAVCMMLAKIFLSYLHVDFQIHRMLAKHHRDSLSQLWDVSAKMLETVLQIIRSRERDFGSPRDLPTIVLAFGLPPAVILTAALQDILQDASRLLPQDLSWSTLVRNLSVFNSHLESICGPGQLNHEFCAHASKAISRTLDETLNSLASSPNKPASASNLISPSIQYTTPSALPALDHIGDTEPANPIFVGPASIGLSLNSYNDIINLNDFDALDGIDLTNWAMNIDWAGSDGVWNTM